MGTVDEIRARWEAVQSPIIQKLKMPPMAAHEVFVDNADDDIKYLLDYIDELEMIIYHSVRLTDIMREGDSEDTYKAIVAKIDKGIADAWGRLRGDPPDD